MEFSHSEMMTILKYACNYLEDAKKDLSGAIEITEEPLTGLLKQRLSEVTHDLDKYSTILENY